MSTSFNLIQENQFLFSSEIHKSLTVGKSGKSSV